MRTKHIFLILIVPLACGLAGCASLSSPSKEEAVGCQACQESRSYLTEGAITSPAPAKRPFATTSGESRVLGITDIDNVAHKDGWEEYKKNQPPFPSADSGT